MKNIALHLRCNIYTCGAKIRNIKKKMTEKQQKPKKTTLSSHLRMLKQIHTKELDLLCDELDIKRRTLFFKLKNNSFRKTEIEKIKLLYEAKNVKIEMEEEC